MDLIEQTKTDVNTFRTTHAYQGTVNDCFVPWWLARKFGLTAGEAMAQAPGGSHDFGLDGFHLKLSGDMPTLHLIQGKFSSDVRQIRQGVQGFGKILPLLAEIIDGKPTDKAQINSVITRLAAKIQKHRDGLGQLQIHFAVIHLEEQELAVRDKLYGAFEEFREQAKRHLPEHQVSIDAIFPSAALPAVRMTDPVKRHEIRFVGVSGASAEPPVYYLGLAHLADLVKLYESYYDYLFSKNVRSFLMRKANSGPAKYIKASLRQICLEMKRDPQYFLALHNGITLHARSAVQESDRLTIHGPNVLNGCQTVKTAYLFRHDLNLRDRIDDARWNNVRVPLRVVITEDEALIRSGLPEVEAHR
ncbi:AIPR family protein, partial [bacterium]|nr:AIPR family protein [bacterium]